MNTSCSIADAPAYIAGVACIGFETCGAGAAISVSFASFAFGTLIVNEMSNGFDAMNQAFWKAHPYTSPPPQQIKSCSLSVCGMPRNTEGGPAFGNGRSSAGQPGIQPPSSPTRAGQSSYTVASGDSLWAIAARFYGSGSQWQRLYQNNQGVIGRNPNLIRPGERLRL